MNAYQLYARDFVTYSKQEALRQAREDWEDSGPSAWIKGDVLEFDDYGLEIEIIEEIPPEPLVVSSQYGVYDETPPFTIFDPEKQAHLPMVFQDRVVAQQVCDFLNQRQKRG